LGEKNIDVAWSYNNIGIVYSDKSEYEKALEYYQKALEIQKELLGEKHTNVADFYKNIGLVYADKFEYDKALEYYQKALVSILINYNDTENLLAIPAIQDYLDWKMLLISLYQKSKVLSLETANVEKLQSALNHYLACDTLISLVRKEMTTENDKLELGNYANLVNSSAVKLCYRLWGMFPEEEKYKELAFYFSERNKTAVLLESLSANSALQTANIPTELTEKEFDLRKDI